MSMIPNDVRYAVRLIMKNGSSSLFIMLVLAVGIGANTAIFSMVDAIVRRPFPFPDITRIVTLSEASTKRNAQRYDVSPANFLDWRDENRVFEEIAAYRTSSAILRSHNGKEPVDVSQVTPGFFQILGLPPHEGRYYSEHQDDTEQRQIVLSYRCWQQRMGADPNIIGKKIDLDGVDYDVIGVAPNQLDFPIYTEIWKPLIFSPADRSDRSRRDLSIIAKLKAGRGMSDARSEMSRISLELARRYPVSNADTGVTVLSLVDSFNSYSRSFVLILMGAVAFVLLLACANVANLQLARITIRRKEIAIRTALGASRAQIMRQLFVEGLMLSLLGAAPGVVVATELLAYIRRNMTASVMRNIAGFSNVAIDTRALSFTLLAAVLSAVLFVLPAIYQALQGRLFQVLKEEGRGTSPTKGGRKIRSVLVVTEVMLAVLLLVGATLMISAFNRITAANRGYVPEGVSFFSLDLSSSQYADPVKVKDLYKRTSDQVREIRGVQSVGAVSVLPSVGDSQSSQVSTEDSGPRPEGGGPSMEVRVVNEDYFTTMSIPLKTGRFFTQFDNSGSQPVAIVSESAARALWRGRSPLGRTLKLLSGRFDMPWLSVVGEVGDVNYFFLNSEIRPTIYITYQQAPAKPMTLLVRMSSGVTGTARAIRAAAQQADAAQDVYRVTSMLDLLDDMAGGVKIVARLMQGLGLLALLLCASGVYAIVSYSVAQRTQEIGVRMALGAQKSDVFRLVLKFSLKLVAIGLALGVPLAATLGYLMSHVLRGLVTVPPFSFIWLVALMLLLAVGASFPPARRALHISPVSALR